MNKTPRDKIMNRPPDESTFPEYLDPSIEVSFLTLESSAELMEHEMVVALLNLMSNAKRDTDKIAAIRETGELLGKKAKNQVNLINADNVQLNQLTASPEIQQHLLTAASGLVSVANARDSGVRSKFGGKGF